MEENIKSVQKMGVHIKYAFNYSHLNVTDTIDLTTIDSNLKFRKTRAMYTKEEQKLLRKSNYSKIRELVRVSFGLGVNLTSPSFLKDSLRLVNVFLLVSSILSFYGHWNWFLRYIDQIPKIAETICTALQTLISMVKMFYYLFTQRKFYYLLKKAQSHEILNESEIFKGDFPVKSKLRVEIQEIMDGIWNDIRRQLIFYLVACTAIISNYFFVAIFINIYKEYKGLPENYEPVLPFPSYYPIFQGTGLSFPYYHIQVELEGAADYIAGMCAFSFDGLFIVLCLHGVGLIRALKVMIKYSTSSDIPKEKRIPYLRCCIYQYERVYEYVFQVIRIYQHISLSQFILSLVVLGIVLFQINFGLESDLYTFIRMLMYITAAGYEIILFCYNAQRLSTESEGISYAFYESEWYNESEEFKLLLRMMLMRTNRSFQFNVSWFTTMSLPTLMSLLRTSGSYFLLLRNLST